MTDEEREERERQLEDTLQEIILCASWKEDWDKGHMQFQFDRIGFLARFELLCLIGKAPCTVCEQGATELDHEGHCPICQAKIKADLAEIWQDVIGPGDIKLLDELNSRNKAPKDLDEVTEVEGNDLTM